MPAGALFVPGEQKVRPGVYFRTSNVGINPPAAGEFGTVAVVFASSWGQLGTPVVLEDLFSVDDAFGFGGGTDALRQTFYGGSSRTLGMRVGSGGTIATRTLVDTTGAPVNAVRLDAKSAGLRGNDIGFILRNSVTNEATMRELLVYLDGTLVQTITFERGAGNGGEPAKLVAAVVASGSKWITATELNPTTHNDILKEELTEVALQTGADPTPDAAAYLAAMGALANYDFDWVVLDTNDADIHATFAAWVNDTRNDGRFIKAVIGEPITVALADRQNHAAAFNDPPIVYVGNGVVTAQGNLDGWKAAARLAGMIVGTPHTSSLTQQPMQGATDVYGALSGSEIEASINRGMVTFTKNALGQTVVEYGITTYVTVNAIEDAGYKKIRRLRTRDNLMVRVARAWTGVVGTVNNNAIGQGYLVQLANRVINEMISEQALLQGRCYVDPANPPSGDTAFFVLEVDDIDSMERVYLRFGLRFAPPSES